MINSIIKQMCSEKGISVTGLEKKLGFGRGTITKWKNSSPTVENLQKVANFFGVDINCFFERKE